MIKTAWSLIWGIEEFILLNSNYPNSGEKKCVLYSNRPLIVRQLQGKISPLGTKKVANFNVIFWKDIS